MKIAVVRHEHNEWICTKYGDIVMLDEYGDCSLCGATLVDRVVVEVSGGVAETTHTPRGVEVEIIDHDNFNARIDERNSNE